MHDDAIMNNIANENQDLFCDFELILGLHVILSFLDYVHILIKLAHSYLFVCYFTDAMKI
jgi:hypothetical protein